MTYRWLFAALLVLAGGVALTAAELQPRTVAAFDRYLDRNPRETEDDVRIALSGNLCRCTGYDGIVKAVLSVSESAG